MCMATWSKESSRDEFQTHTGESSQTQAEENAAIVCSMDDPKLYGEELHRLGFGEAVGSGLLSDYKVMVLSVEAKFVSKAFQRQLSLPCDLRLGV